MKVCCHEKELVQMILTVPHHNLCMSLKLSFLYCGWIIQDYPNPQGNSRRDLQLTLVVVGCR